MIVFLVVLEGESMVFGGKMIRRGVFFFTSAGVLYGPLSAPRGCVLLIHFYGSPWQQLNCEFCAHD